MPSDISTLATTMSITRKGRNSRKPISKARFSSPTMKAGTSARQGASPAIGRGQAREVEEQRRSSSRTLRGHEAAEGLGRGLQPLHLAHAPSDIG
jgi:hypothetical protein